jgi:hypothetical protein
MYSFLVLRAVQESQNRKPYEQYKEVKTQLNEGCVLRLHNERERQFRARGGGGGTWTLAGCPVVPMPSSLMAAMVQRRSTRPPPVPLWSLSFTAVMDEPPWFSYLHQHSFHSPYKKEFLPSVLQPELTDWTYTVREGMIFICLSGITPQLRE